jgi:DNA-binding transcriptional regulator YdaS (Cro superfamily)
VKTQDAIEHFKSARQLAKALGIWPTAISQWGEKVPPRRAYEIERLTNGALKADLEIGTGNVDTKKPTAA